MQIAGDVVDEDMAIENMNDVIERCARARSEGWAGYSQWLLEHLDPMSYSHEDRRNSRVVVDAATVQGQGQLPAVARASKELTTEFVQGGDVLRTNSWEPGGQVESKLYYSTCLTVWLASEFHQF